MAEYKKGHVKVKDVDLDEIDFAVDTAGSWDGSFPKRYDGNMHDGPGGIVWWRSN